MSADSAFGSPHSSVNFTPFGRDALTLNGEDKEPVLSEFAKRISSRLAPRSLDRLQSSATTGTNADGEDRRSGPAS
jgi:hypothetical protein